MERWGQYDVYIVHDTIKPAAYIVSWYYSAGYPARITHKAANALAARTSMGFIEKKASNQLHILMESALGEGKEDTSHRVVGIRTWTVHVAIQL